MKRIVVTLTLIGVVSLGSAEAARVRVHRGPAGRVHVTVTRGFPIQRALPDVVVRTRTVRVAPRAYLAPAVFAGVVVVLPAQNHRVWNGSEVLNREDGWVDFSLDVNQRGDRLLLEVDRGAAQVSFAEVVFENGDAQVVDFNDHVRRTGTYSLFDFKDGRKVDHVRIVAKAGTAQSVIRLHLTT